MTAITSDVPREKGKTKTVTGDIVLRPESSVEGKKTKNKKEENITDHHKLRTQNE